jgi:hypothetical protein
MLYLRMLRVAWRLTRPHLFAPWRSPLLRWRLETYGITDAAGRLVHADEITPALTRRFSWRHRTDLIRFLRWAAELDRPPALRWPPARALESAP